jgi:peptide/nickel transport system substrate-binding protein
LATALAVGLAAVVGGAVAGGAAVAGQAAVAQGQPSPSSSPPTAATPSPPGGATVDQLRVPFPQDEGLLTPYTFELGYSLVTLLYDTLMWRDASGQPQPWLAESVERSANRRRVTVRLARDARWHDGRPVTAEDVAFTFDYVATRYHPRFTGQADAIQRVEVVDEHTVVFHLAHPAPGFFDQPLADVPILPAHLWRDLAPGRRAPEGPPVGSGPYELAGDAEDGYRFVADPDYFRGAPAVATLRVPIVSEAEATLRALERGRADLLSLPLSEGMRRRLSGLGIGFLEGTSYRGIELRVNTRRAPFDDPDVRAAVAAAVDLQRVARAVGGDAVPATRGYLHPQSPWAASEVVHRADVDAARRGLAEADVGSLEVLAPENDPVKVTAARQVVSALGRAGVDAQLDTVGPEAHADALGVDGSRPTFRLAVASGFPLASHDPDFLAQALDADGKPALNRTGYHSDAFASAMRRVSRTFDDTARQKAVDEALAILAEDVPVLPLVFPEGAFAYRRRVYDRWVFVHGSGPLDKRSFVAGGAQPSVGSEPSPRVSPKGEAMPQGGPADGSSPSGQRASDGWSLPLPADWSLPRGWSVALSQGWSWLQNRSLPQAVPVAVWVVAGAAFVTVLAGLVIAILTRRRG